jgi:RimJ/RimL family protein N-acetyltransferase
MKIRPVNLETDLPWVATNYSDFERSKAILPDEVRSWVDTAYPGRIAQMFVAFDANNSIQGSVEISHESWHSAGQYTVFILVDPRRRGQKIGSALWEASVDFLHQHPVASLISSVWDDDPASRAFAERCGFTIERHAFISHLDLNTFKESPYLSDIARLEKEGIQFGSLADFPDTPETDQKYCDLCAAIDQDMPGMDWNFDNYADFFHEHVLGSHGYRREGQLLAFDGNTWVGYASIHFDPGTCRGHNFSTGVIRSHRGRKIAQALKIQTIRYARNLGAVTIDTNNDSLNAPMLAINQKFGYQPQPGKYKLVCQVKGRPQGLSLDGRKESMAKIHLRPENPEKDFEEIARLISTQEGFAQSKQDLLEDYQRNKDTRLQIRVAEDRVGDFMGFSWAWQHWLHSERAELYLVVKPEYRQKGAGRLLYEELATAMQGKGYKAMGTSVMEDSPESLAFIQRRGFVVVRHSIRMEMDLDEFDDRPFDAIIERLKGEGFCFTSMEELGNTEEAQRNLYDLNETVQRSIPGQTGDPAWANFEAFQKGVCGSKWYRPAGQIIAIDTATGKWAGMSAISIMGEVNYAYNLFTGVDMAYRNRKLAQAVKVLALRYARSTLGIHSVQTDHNIKNLPMIAIDNKLGYRKIWGKYFMEKAIVGLDQDSIQE